MKKLFVKKSCLLILLVMVIPLVFATETKPSPCEADVYRQFDFWLGEWTVELKDGKPAGNNRITRENKCLILEQWQSTRGGRGSSVNYYNPKKRQWVQHWIDDTSIIHLHGNLHDGSMVLEGTILDIGSGETSPLKGSWTPLPDGRVRQYFEQKQDGKWQPWFEGFYKKTNN